MLNLVPAQAEVRQPRGIVKVGGVVVPGAISFEVDNNNYYASDTFRVEFAASMLPADRGVDWWAAQTEITVEIFAGFPASVESFTSSELDSLILGQVDSVNFNPVSRVLSVSGRDLTARMIDTKTTVKYPNQKSSDIAKSVATSHGLTPVVTATTRKVGTFYQIDAVRLTDQTSEWDLLTFLANAEGFVVYVKGNELHFEPKPAATSEPYKIKWQDPDESRGYHLANVMQLSLSRELTVAKGVVVWVQSTNPKTKKTYSVAFPSNKAKGTKPGQSSPHLQVYTFRRPAMTPEAAQAFAQTKHKELTQHELRMAATLPADGILTVASVIQLTGTGSVFDQIYYPDSIVRRMSFDEGYMMEISAKNIAHINEVTL